MRVTCSRNYRIQL